VKAALILMLLLAYAAAAPVINSAPSSVSDGQTITISGSGFGSGPTVTLYEDFEVTGDSGAVLPPDSVTPGSVINKQANIGAWSSTDGGWNGATGVKYDSNHVSGNYGGRMYDPDVGHNMAQVKFSGTREFMLSYWFLWPEGTREHRASDIDCFPYEKGGPSVESCTNFKYCEYDNPSENPSVWKFAWIQDSSDGCPGGADDDLIILAKATSNQLLMSGNDIGTTGAFKYIYSSSNTPDSRKCWFRHGQWVRVTAWAESPDDNLQGTMNVYFQALSPGKDPALMYEVGPTTTTFSQIDRCACTYPHEEYCCGPSGDTCIQPETEQWNYLNVLGWMRTTKTPNCRLVFDDMYLATGPNANARVEIGDKPVYSDCTKLFLGTTTSWSNSRITFNVNRGNFASGQSAYLYVIDANNQVSNAYPLKFSGTCTPSCSSKECGPDNCGGTCPPGCSDTESCVSGQCVANCVPSCSGKQCGDDGCGGDCGACAEGDCIDYKCVVDSSPFETWGDVPGAEHPGTITDTFLNLNSNNYEGQDISVWQYQLNPPKLPANTIIISADLSTIGGSNIQSAKLKLYMKDKYGEDQLTTSTHKLNKQPVMAEATGYKASNTQDWTAVPAGTTSNGAPLGLADIGPAADTVTLGTAYGIVSYDITSIVQDCVQEEAACNFLVRGYDTTAETGRMFASNEDADPYLRPRIEISYSHPADTDSDGQVSLAELASYMNLWKTSQGPSIADLMSAIKLWKTQ